ncbi:unnamed protein product [Calypogeia fissa]
MAMGLLRRVEAVVAIIVVTVAFGALSGSAQLSPGYYGAKCLLLEPTVRFVFERAKRSDPRIGASLLRMHFHDCFVQGCDASITLVDTPTFTGEQTAVPNDNSIRGFDVLENIKAAVEFVCPNTVSCADILALVARIAVVSDGGPFWTVEFGRRDSTTACFSCANTQIPSPFQNVAGLTQDFVNKGLSETDMVALSGAHTFGKAHCGLITNRLGTEGSPAPDQSLNPTYRQILLNECTSASVLVNLDVTTPTQFDNAYYTNLKVGKGLLGSDQTLFSEGDALSTRLVNLYSLNPAAFGFQFAVSMIKMGRITPLTGTQGQIRKQCSVVNP